MALTILVGNMGLALMGTAIAINSVVAGWFGGAIGYRAKSDLFHPTGDSHLDALKPMK